MARGGIDPGHDTNGKAIGQQTIQCTAHVTAHCNIGQQGTLWNKQMRQASLDGHSIPSIAMSISSCSEECPPLGVMVVMVVVCVGGFSNPPRCNH